MYVSVIPIFLYLISGTTAQTWEYTITANTTDGQSCISNCKNNRCIADWKGSTKECWTNNQPSPKYRTAEVMDKSNHYCLSNCGYFGYNYQWCVTSDNKSWDYCNAERRSVSIYKKACKDECHKGPSDYYWCYVENRNDWQYCAPPMELDSDYDISDIDHRHNN